MQGEARTHSVGSCKIDCGTLDAMLVGICWISSFVGSHSCVGFLGGFLDQLCVDFPLKRMTV